MNKTLFTSLALLLCQHVCSQDYRPLVEEGKAWKIADVKASNEIDKEFDIAFYNYRIQGDSVVDGRVWKRLFAVDETGMTLRQLIREEDKKVCVYRKGVEGGCMIFDFGVSAGDSLSLFAGIGILGDFSDFMETDNRVSDVGKITLEGSPYNSVEIEKTFQVEDAFEGADEEVSVTCRWIEGVGCTEGFLNVGYQLIAPQCICFAQIVECSVNGDVIYRNVPATLQDILSTPNVGYNAEKGAKNLHDLQGRRLTQEPQQGVFIRDGRKVVKGN